MLSDAIRGVSQSSRGPYHMDYKKTQHLPLMSITQNIESRESHWIKCVFVNRANVLGWRPLLYTPCPPLLTP